jgi:gliding motility-associated-like protein
MFISIGFFGSALPVPGVMSLDTIKPCPLPSDPNNPSPVAGTLITAANPSPGLIEGFVLHTGSGNVIGDIISYNCLAPNFGDFNNPLTFGLLSTTNTIVLGEIYYISSVTWTSCGDLTSIVETSVGQPVIWSFDRALEVALVPPSAPINLCDGDIFNLEVSFSVPGHYDVTYVIDGLNPSTASFAASSNDEVMQFPISDSGTYCINNVTLTESTCPININNASCVLAKFFSTPDVTISSNASICVGDEHCFEIDIAGQGPFTVLIDNAVGSADVYTSQPPGILSHCVNEAGFYSVQELIDFNGCQPEILPTPVQLIVNPLPSAAITSELPVSICNDFCEQVSLEITTGSFPMMVALQRLQGSDTIYNVFASPWSFDVCEPGSYSIIEISDANSCISAQEYLFEANTIAMPESAAGADQELCLNESVEIGSVAVLGASYNWQDNVLINASFQQNSQIIITPVDTGWVSLILDVTKEGCLLRDTVSLYAHVLPEVSIDLSSNAICSGQCTELVFAGADEYSWNEPFIDPTPVINDTLVLCPESSTNYVITGTNNYGSLLCSSSQLLPVSVSLGMSASVVSEEVCFGSCDGSATIIVSGGIPPYFSASVNSDFIAEALCPGYNEVIFSDAAGCIDTIGFNIIERPQEVVDYFSALPPVCFGDATGQVNAYDVSADYMSIYQGNNVFPFLTDDTAPYNFSNLPAGNYRLIMTVDIQGNSCLDTIDFIFESLSPPIDLALNVDEGPYCDQSQVCLQALGSGGFGSLVPHWNRCEESINCQSSQLNPFCFSITRDTVFYVHVTDQNGCTSDTLSVAPFLYEPLNTSLTGIEDSALVCEYNCIQLNASAEGGNGDYHFLWTTAPAGNGNSSDNSEFQFCPTYTVPFQRIVVKLFDNCVADVRDTIVVEVKNTPDFQLSANVYDQCVDSEFKLYYDLEPNFLDAFSCRWNFDFGNDIDFCGDTAVVFTSPGLFEPHLSITSEFGCTGQDTMSENFITVYQQPELDFWWEPAELDILNTNVQFNCEPYGIDSVIWNFHNAGRSTLFDPIWSFPSVESETPFFVCMVGYSGKGCLDTLCRDVYVNPVAQVFAPNSFTPNGDGINDVFQPFVSGAQPGTFSFTIYTRRGETIFYSEETDAVWTGGINDNGYYVAPGPYVWRIEFLAKQTDKIEVYTGTINLLR